MKSRPLLSQLDRLRWLLSQAKTFGEDQVELRSHWARYLCVLASGFLENALRETYGAYARSCSNSFVANFVESRLRQIQNPKAARFLETAGAFSSEWRDKLQEVLDDDGNGAAIDAIVTNRNSISHGKDSDITLARLNDYPAGDFAPLCSAP